MIAQIIVVDDDSIILKRAWNTLTEAGFKVVVLKSGNALLEYMEKQPAPNLILMDINMPEMDGFEVIQKLKKGKVDWRDTPVIFMTANEDEESETKGLKLGAMDFIKKPFVPDVLALRVRHIIDLNRLQKNLEMEVEKETKERARQIDLREKRWFIRVLYIVSVNVLF